MALPNSNTTRAPQQEHSVAPAPRQHGDSPTAARSTTHPSTLCGGAAVIRIPLTTVGGSSLHNTQSNDDNSQHDSRGRIYCHQVHMDRSKTTTHNTKTFIYNSVNAESSISPNPPHRQHQDAGAPHQWCVRPGDSPEQPACERDHTLVTAGRHAGGSGLPPNDGSTQHGGAPTQAPPATDEALRKRPPRCG